MSADEHEIGERGGRHKWGAPVTVIDGTPSNCEQTERTCVLCEMVKVTVHPPQGMPWREWRPKDGPQIQLEHTPPCRAGKNAQ
jgi:hypothetical protein